MAIRENTPIIDYVPQGYRHRQTQAVGWAVFAVVVALAIGWFDWRNAVPPLLWQMLIVGTPVVMTACALFFGWTSECRVEGNHLWFASTKKSSTSVPVADIISIDQVDSGEGFHFEIHVRERGRMKVRWDVFHPMEPLRRALLALNPKISFRRRPAGYCANCGASTPVAGIASSGSCHACGQRFASYGRFV